MNEHEKDHLAELKDIDGDSLDELADFYPMLGRSAKKRILEKCLEKTDEAEFRNGITVAGTEIYKRPVWSRVLGAAAAFVAAGAVVSGAVLLNKDRLNEQHQLSCESSESSAVTTIARTERVTSAVSTTQQVTTTTAEVEIYVQTSEYIAYATSAPFIESTTTSETTETTETTTTDVTTTDSENEQPTTETSAEIRVEDLTGSWITSGGERSRIFEFYADGSGGKVSVAETGLGFTYAVSDDVITFRFAAEDTDPESGIIRRLRENSFEISWFDGTTEIFTRMG